MADWLDDAARSALARARDLASQHKHESVDLDHALLALLGESSVRKKIEAMAVSVEELDVRLQAGLAARVAAAAYRDATPPERTARLEAAVQRASPNAVLRLLRRGTPEQLFLALVAESDVAQRLFDARLGALTISSVLEHATLLAVARGHQFVRVEHALLAVCDSEWLGAALEQLDVSHEQLVEVLEDVLRSETSYEPSTLAPTIAMDLATLARQTEASRLPSSSKQAVAFLGQVLRSPLSRSLFDDAGIPRFELMRVLVGGTIDHGPLPEGGLLEVVFHNDDFTTTDFVVGTLRKDFDLPNEQAVAAMRRVHKVGSVVIGTFAADDAKRRVREALSRAQDATMPLRISLRPPRG